MPQPHLGLYVLAFVICACGRPQPLRVSVSAATLRADGNDTSLIVLSAAAKPSVEFRGDTRGAAIENISSTGDQWEVRVRSGVMPGKLSLRISAPGYQPATMALTALLDTSDSAADGTPDFLRLDDDRDRAAFRSWFAWLAEAQYFQSDVNRPREIVDCASLIRYAYREALRKHDGDWASSAHLPELPSLESPLKYRYPMTPLGANLFRARGGAFQERDLTDGTFLQFADAQTLWRYNLHSVGRDLQRAEAGDLLLYRQNTSPVTYHTMVYLGESKFRPDRKRYLVYHTGPSHEHGVTDPGVIKRLTTEELLRFPQSEWRPVAANPGFLGVMRWNILRRQGNDVQASIR